MDVPDLGEPTTNTGKRLMLGPGKRKEELLF